MDDAHIRRLMESKCEELLRATGGDDESRAWARDALGRMDVNLPGVARTLDRILIQDLACRCIIGINDDERVREQEVFINITLHADLRQACVSDDIHDTVDYKNIKQKVLDMVEGSSFYLIERLAETIAYICLASPRVERVTVRVDKPGALRFARSVAIEIERGRE